MTILIAHTGISWYYFLLFLDHLHFRWISEIFIIALIHLITVCVFSFYARKFSRMIIAAMINFPSKMRKRRLQPLIFQGAKCVVGTFKGFRRQHKVVTDYNARWSSSNKTSLVCKSYRSQQNATMGCQR